MGPGNYGLFPVHFLPIFCPHSSLFIRENVFSSLFIRCCPHFLAPVVTVGETEGAMDSASVLFFTSCSAYNFARK